jgi:hypothetical protein
MTGNPLTEEVNPVTIRVVALQQLDEGTAAVLLPLLNQTQGFKFISNRPLRQGFRLSLPDFPNATIRDTSKPYGTGCFGWLLFLLILLYTLLGRKYPLPPPTYEADIQLQPAQFTRLTFLADPSKSLDGEAHIFNLMQIGSDGQIQGGNLLVVFPIPDPVTA